MTIPPMTGLPATTNLLLNPRAADDTTSANGLSSATVARSTDPTPYTATAFSVTTPGAVTQEGVYLFTASSLGITGAANLYSGSAWVGGSGAVTIQLRAFYTDASSTIGTTATVTASEATWPVGVSTLTLDPTKTLNLFRLYIRTDGTQAVTFRLIGQVEAGSATAYTDGTRPARGLSGFLTLADTHIGPLRVGERN